MRSKLFPILVGVCLAGCDLESSSGTALRPVESFTAADLAEQRRTMKALVDRVQILEEEREGMLAVIAKAEALQKYVSVTRQGDVKISGANLHLTNSDGFTPEPNGKGNLIIGYNRGFEADPQLGSHNIAVGTGNTFSGTGGLVVGNHNVINGFGAVAIGQENRATADMAVAIGGYTNDAFGTYASVFGGTANESTGTRSSVFGGANNVSSGKNAAILGGSDNKAEHETSSIIGSRSAHTESTGQSLLEQNARR